MKMVVAGQELRWILRAQAGDKDALNELLKVVQGHLYRYIRSLVADESLAEDILQEVFILIYRKLRWLREPELFPAWSFRIASREAFKHLRRERRWFEQIRDENLLDTIPAPASRSALSPFLEDDAVSLEWKVDPSLNMTLLSPASRAVILLHYMHEMTLEEVAEVLGISIGTVKSRLAYGLRSLRQQVREKSR
jgi:RNA polymerase sigma-70 factor, ECF subfamily